MGWTSIGELGLRESFDSLGLPIQSPSSPHEHQSHKVHPSQPLRGWRDQPSHQTDSECSLWSDNTVLVQINYSYRTCQKNPCPKIDESVRTPFLHITARPFDLEVNDRNILGVPCVSDVWMTSPRQLSCFMILNMKSDTWFVTWSTIQRERRTNNLRHFQLRRP